MGIQKGPELLFMAPIKTSDSYKFVDSLEFGISYLSDGKLFYLLKDNRHCNGTYVIFSRTTDTAILNCLSSHTGTLNTWTSLPHLSL